MISWNWVDGTLLVGTHSSDEVSRGRSFSTVTGLKVASFDLDSTLVETKSGKLHAQDSDDWIWWHETVPRKLKDVYDDGYQITIFTNQGRLTTSRGGEAAEAQVFQQKIEKILEHVTIPLILYAACANDNFRKPRTGMWEYMMKDHGGNVDLGSSYLVGDSAGRAKDHSDSDTHFCINVGIRLFTPEEFFLGSTPEATGHKFDPSWHLATNGIVKDSTSLGRPESALLLVLVGLPGAGKTTYYKNMLLPLGYERINQHQLRELDNPASIADRYLADLKSVVIDDPNEDVEARKPWIALARERNVFVKALNFTTPSDLCLHNDTVRALGGAMMNPESRKIFPRTPFRGLEKRFTRPQVDEGFDEVIDIDFQWSGTDEELKIWSRYWI